jgi:hypothetical protein
MAWAARAFACCLISGSAAASPQRPSDRPPTVFAIQGSGTPAAGDFVTAPGYVLGDATFRFVWTGTGLHVHVSVVDDDVVAAVSEGDDPAAAAEDSIEILLDARVGELDAEAMTRVVVSAAGGVYDTRGIGADEDAAIDRSLVTVTPGDGGWEALVTIDAPSAQIEARGGEVLGLDFAVHDLDGVELVTSDWSGLADLSIVECWSRVQLVGAGDPPEGDDCIGGYERRDEACVKEGGGCAMGARAGGRGSIALLAAAGAVLAVTRRASRRPGGSRRRRTR